MQKKVAIVGNGNLAYHLAKRFWELGHPISGLVVRSEAKAVPFKPFLNDETVITSASNLANHPWDLILIAVADSAISSMIQQTIFPKSAIVIHASGSQPMSVFHATGIQNFGVVYPLQTFSKQKDFSFSEVPLFVEANNRATEEQLLNFSKILSPKVALLSSDKRLRLHMAAVMACNFSNALYAIAEDQLSAAGLDFELLRPLMEETVQKAVTIGPKQAQTGPATRGDSEIITKHLNLLHQSPEIKEVYQLLTNLIANRSKKN
jgi:predicted short-subunit dehydrogenase-like oxidoreductase (DUF2520 family)